MPRAVRGVHLVERAHAGVLVVGWVWIAISVLYLVLLLVVSALYAFAPPWEEDFRLLPPPGTSALWIAISIGWIVNLVRIGGAWALIAGQRGRPAVKVGWCVMAVTLVAPVGDAAFNIAERVRGTPGRFTPIPIGVLAIASLVVLVWPRTLAWVWTLGPRHIPKLHYAGNFAQEQALELGIESLERHGDGARTTGAPPASSTPGLPPIVPYEPGRRPGASAGSDGGD